MCKQEGRTERNGTVTSDVCVLLVHEIGLARSFFESFFFSVIKIAV